MLIIKKKDYINWLQYLESLHNNRTFISFCQFKYLSNDQNFFLLRQRFAMQKIPSSYLSFIDKFFFAKFKGNPIYSLALNEELLPEIINSLSSSLNFLVFLSKSQSMFIYNYSIFFESILIIRHLIINRLKHNFIIQFLIIEFLTVFLVKYIINLVKSNGIIN